MLRCILLTHRLARQYASTTAALLPPDRAASAGRDRRTSFPVFKAAVIFYTHYVYSWEPDSMFSHAE